MTAAKIRPWASLNWPNRISLIRLLLVAPFIVLLMNQNQWPHARHAALLIFVAMAFSDLLDGVLARRLSQRTTLGAILDPLADKVLIICAVVLLSLPESAVPEAVISNWVVVAIVAKDLWVIIGFVVVYLVTDRMCVRPTRAGKTATFGQLVMVALVLAAPDVNEFVPQAGTRLATGAEWLTVALSVASVISYTRLGLSFLAEADKPLEANGPKDGRTDARD